MPVVYNQPISTSFGNLIAPAGLAGAAKTPNQWVIPGPNGYLLILASETGDFTDAGTGTITNFGLKLGSTLIVNASVQGLTLQDFLAAFTTGAGGAAYLFSGHDDVAGTWDSDFIEGFGGDDTLTGNDGADQIYGGAGFDILYGEEGGDTLDGGNDGGIYSGGAGNDLIIIGAGGRSYVEVDGGTDDNSSDSDILRIDGAVTAKALCISAVERLVLSPGASLTTSFPFYFDDLGSTLTVQGSAGGNALVFNFEAAYPLGVGKGPEDKPSPFHDFRGFTFESWGTEDLFVVNGSSADETIFGPSVSGTYDGGGGTDFIVAGAGQDRIAGGAGADVLIGGAGNDTYVVDALDSLIEKAGGGTDTVLASASFSLADFGQVENLAMLSSSGTTSAVLTGNARANVITGNAGANTLNGEAGADVLRGGLGNDILIGGLGRDKLDGGKGKDIFLFNTALGSAHVDTILAYVPKDDTIRLDDAIFTGLHRGKLPADAFHLGRTAEDAEDRILYDKGTGSLYYDADGTGGLAAIRFSVLANKPAIGAGEFVIV